MRTGKRTNLIQNAELTWFPKLVVFLPSLKKSIKSQKSFCVKRKIWYFIIRYYVVFLCKLMLCEMDNSIICHYINWIFFIVLYLKSCWNSLSITQVVSLGSSLYIKRSFTLNTLQYHIKYKYLFNCRIYSSCFFPLLTFCSFITTDLYSLVLLIQLCSKLYVSEGKWKIYLTAGIFFFIC